MKKYKAIIYDLDGTLLDTIEMNMVPLLQIIKEELNEEWKYEDVLKFTSYTGINALKELKIKDPEETHARWVQYVNAYEKGAKLFDGVEEVIKIIQQKGIKQAIVSSKKKAQYQIDFVSYGLDQYMDVVILEEDTIRHKPDPEPIELCLKQLNLNKEDVIYIGDALGDYKVSQNAGIDFGYAKWGSVISLDKQPTVVLENVKDILLLV